MNISKLALLVLALAVPGLTATAHASIIRDKDGEFHPVRAPGKFQPRYKGVKLDGKRIGLPLKRGRR
jgi:hypothetical protein